MYDSLTPQALVKVMLEWLVGFAQLVWVALIRPYPWLWVAVIAVLVVERIWPARRR